MVTYTTETLTTSGSSSFAAGNWIIYAGNTVNDTVVFNDSSANYVDFYGGAGTNTITFGSGTDIYYGGTGNDKVTFGNGTDIAYAGSGTDNITFGNGNDTATGGSGADTFTFGNGNNTLTGGSGTSTITFGNGTNTFTASAGSGAESITFGNGSDYANASSRTGNDTLSFGNGINTAFAGAGTDTMTFGNGNDIVHAGAGTDTITFGNGSNTFFSGGGSDTVTAGNGSDTMYFIPSLKTSTTYLDQYTAGNGNNTLVINFSGFTLPSGYATWAAYETALTNLFNSEKSGHVDFRTLSSGELNLVATGFKTLSFTTTDTPIAQNVASTALEGTSNNPINVLTLDSDPLGAALSIQSVATPAHGTAQIQTINGTQEIVYTPTSNFVGTDTFNYTIVNSHGTTATASISVNVLGSGTVTFGDTNQTYTAGSGTDTVIFGDGNDTATAGSGTDTIIMGNGNDIFNSGAGSDTVIAGNGTDTMYFTPSLKTSSSYLDQYTAGNGTDTLVINFTGSTLPAGYASWAAYKTALTNLFNTDIASNHAVDFRTLTAGELNLVATGFKVISFTGGFDTPTASNFTLSTPEDSSNPINVLAQATDPDGATLSITSVATPAHGTASIQTISGIQEIVYTPTPGFVGTDTFNYTLTDTNNQTATASISFTVTPILTESGGVTYNGETITNGTAALQGVAPGGSTITITETAPTNQQISQFTVASNGNWTFTPGAPLAAGTYTVHDSTAGTTNTTFVVDNVAPSVSINSITVDGDTVPLTSNSSIYASSSATATINGSVTDAAGLSVVAGETVHVSDSVRSLGTATVQSNGTWSLNVPMSTLIADDLLTLNASLTSAGGNTGSLSLTGITVASTEPTPIIGHTTIDTSGNTSFFFTAPTLSDADPNAQISLQISASGLPAGTIVTDNTVTLTASGGNYLINSGDSITIVSATPFADFTLTASASNHLGATSSSTSETAFTAASQSYTFTEDTSTSESAQNGLLVNASNPSQITSINVIQPPHGTVQANSDGSFTYTPNQGYTGVDSITYEIFDAKGDFAFAVAAITVDAAPFTAASATFTDSANTTTPVEDLAAVNLPAGDVITDMNGAVSGSLTSTHGGTVNFAVQTINNVPTPTFTYTPQNGFYGSDSFTFTLTDHSGYTTPSQTVTINIPEPAPSLSAPTVSEDFTLSSGNPVFEYSFTAPTPTDADANSALSLTLSGLPAGATVSDNGQAVALSNGSYTLQIGDTISISSSTALSNFTLNATASDNGLSANTSVSVSTPAAFTATGAITETASVNAFNEINDGTTNTAPVLFSGDYAFTLSTTAPSNINQANLVTELTNIPVGDAVVTWGYFGTLPFGGPIIEPIQELLASSTSNVYLIPTSLLPYTAIYSPNGSGQSITVTDLVTDNSGNYISSSAPISVPLMLAAPTITSATITGFGGSYTFNINASDVDPNALITFNISGLAPSDELFLTQIISGQVVPVQQITPNSDGSYTVTASEIPNLLLFSGSPSAETYTVTATATDSNVANPSVTSAPVTSQFSLPAPVFSVPGISPTVSTGFEEGTLVYIYSFTVPSATDADSNAQVSVELPLSSQYEVLNQLTPTNGSQFPSIGADNTYILTPGDTLQVFSFTPLTSNFDLIAKATDHGATGTTTMALSPINLTVSATLTGPDQIQAFNAPADGTTQFAPAANYSFSLNASIANNSDPNAITLYELSNIPNGDAVIYWIYAGIVSGQPLFIPESFTITNNTTFVPASELPNTGIYSPDGNSQSITVTAIEVDNGVTVATSQPVNVPFSLATPTITSAAITGFGGSYTFNINASDVDPNALITFNISGLAPSDELFLTEIISGQVVPVQQITPNSNGSYTVTASEIPNLLLFSSSPSAETFTVTATATDSNVANPSAASTPFTSQFTAPSPIINTASFVKTGADTFALNLTTSEQDPHTSISYLLSGFSPNDILTSNGNLLFPSSNGTGSYFITSAQLSNLVVTSSSITPETIAITALALDTLTGASSAPYTILSQDPVYSYIQDFNNAPTISGGLNFSSSGNNVPTLLANYASPSQPNGAAIVSQTDQVYVVGTDTPLTGIVAVVNSDGTFTIESNGYSGPQVASEYIDSNGNQETNLGGLGLLAFNYTLINVDTTITETAYIDARFPQEALSGTVVSVPQIYSTPVNLVGPQASVLLTSGEFLVALPASDQVAVVNITSEYINNTTNVVISESGVVSTVLNDINLNITNTAEITNSHAFNFVTDNNPQDILTIGATDGTPGQAALDQGTVGVSGVNGISWNVTQTDTQNPTQTDIFAANVTKVGTGGVDGAIINDLLYSEPGIGGNGGSVIYNLNITDSNPHVIFGGELGTINPNLSTGTFLDYNIIVENGGAGGDIAGGGAGQNGDISYTIHAGGGNTTIYVGSIGYPNLPVAPPPVDGNLTQGIQDISNGWLDYVVQGGSGNLDVILGGSSGDLFNIPSGNVNLIGGTGTNTFEIQNHPVSIKLPDGTPSQSTIQLGNPNQPIYITGVGNSNTLDLGTSTYAGASDPFGSIDNIQNLILGSNANISILEQDFFNLMSNTHILYINGNTTNTVNLQAFQVAYQSQTQVNAYTDYNFHFNYQNETFTIAVENGIHVNLHLT